MLPEAKVAAFGHCRQAQLLRIVVVMGHRASNSIVALAVAMLCCCGSDQKTISAPRDLTRSIPQEYMDPPGSIDGCTYNHITAGSLQYGLQQSHFAAVANIDYDYRSVEAIRYKDGSEASSRLTPLSISGVVRVLEDKVGLPIDNFYLVGTCNQNGLCTISNCKSYVNSGANLILGSRFCWSDSLAGPAKTVVFVNQVFPYEDGALYDFDGTPISFDSLMAGYVPQQSDLVNEQATCAP